MRKTILQLVQSMGVALNSDEIDSLDESQETRDMVDILSRVYDEVLDRRTWEFMKDRVLQLDDREAGDLMIAKLTIPPSVLRIQKLKYSDSNGVFKELIYLPAEEFVDMVHRNDASESFVDTLLSPDGVPLYIRNDRTPTHWTSFNETEVVFNSYDSAIAAGIQSASSAIIATIKPVADFSDPAAYLPVPERMETLILNEAKVTANYELRQMADPRSAGIARRQHVSLRETEPVTNRDQQERHYGRRTKSGR